jgi:hypothetical protein
MGLYIDKHKQQVSVTCTYKTATSPRASCNAARILAGQPASAGAVIMMVLAAVTLVDSMWASECECQHTTDVPSQHLLGVLLVGHIMYG